MSNEAQSNTDESSLVQSINELSEKVTLKLY